MMVFSPWKNSAAPSGFLTRSIFSNSQGRHISATLELGIAAPKLVVLESPYRFIVSPIVDYVLDLQRKDETAKSLC
jgi:hypothetical protein